jgi:hypothetical protein
MREVTIHTYSKEWKGAVIVGTGKDSFMQTEDVLIVQHPEFKYGLDFYATPDAQGKRYNVGNRAFWITEP